MSEYLTLKEVAKQLGYKDKGTVKQLLLENEVEIIKPGKHYLVNKKAFENYLKSTKV